MVNFLNSIQKQIEEDDDLLILYNIIKKLIFMPPRLCKNSV